MNCVMVSYSDHCNSIFIERVSYKHKNWQLDDTLTIPIQISLFSPHMHKVTFSGEK